MKTDGHSTGPPRKIIRSFPSVAAAARFSLAAAAHSVPGTINSHGRLTDTTPAQTPFTETVNMQFEIWSRPRGGAPVGSQVTRRRWTD